MSSGLGVRPMRCAWCDHSFSAHNSLLQCCIRGCRCVGLELMDALEDQHTMEVCV